MMDSIINIHPTAIIETPCQIGKGTKIWHFCHICKDVVIGENCVLGQNVYIGPGVIIGNHVKIQNNVSVYEGVEIADRVFLGPSCVFTNVKHPTAKYEAGFYEKTFIEEGAVIGANATIICPVCIYSNAVVGAGSVVTKDVPPNITVVGSPARELKK